MVNPNHVIDAMNYAKGLAHFANDANGVSKAEGATNNCQYEALGLRIYITAITDIPAGSKLFVDYWESYWTNPTVKKNRRYFPYRNQHQKIGKSANRVSGVDSLIFKASNLSYQKQKKSSRNGILKKNAFL